MWCVCFLDNNDEVLHAVCMEDEPTKKDVDNAIQEVYEDEEFNKICDYVKHIKVVEVNDISYNDLVKYGEKNGFF